MKILVNNISFNKTAKTVIFNDYATIYQRGIMGVINDTKGVIIYQPNNVLKGGTCLTNVLTLTYNTSSMDNADILTVIYDDGKIYDTNSGNKSDNTQRFVLATDQPQLTNKLLVTPDSVALPDNQKVNINQINSATPLMGAGNGGTGSLRVNVASDQVAIPITKAISKAYEQVTDWTSVAQNAIGQSAILDCSTHAKTLLCIQAFLDTQTAHLGTSFVVQISSNSAGNEDWYELQPFTALIGTANSEPVTNNPLAANATSITCASTTGYTPGLYIAIKDATLINSEIAYITAIAANTSITILDGVTNQHANTAMLYNMAMTQVYNLPDGTMRARVIVNNTISASGSTVCYKVQCTKSLSL